MAYDQWIDISVTLVNGLVSWPGDPRFHIKRAEDQSKGASANVSEVAMGVHTGTHMDAPIHFISGGKGIDQFPLDAAVGPALVVDTGTDDVIEVHHLPAELPDKARILFKTRNSQADWTARPFNKDFVYLSTEAAHALVARHAWIIGVDYLSVGGYEKNEKEVHTALLEAGIWIIEGLYLVGVPAGRYQMICLPIKLGGSDGAPARVMLRRLD